MECGLLEGDKEGGDLPLMFFSTGQRPSKPVTDLED
jgi:hypothetical protein